MMKKTVKLMVAIALATGFGMSAFMESAEAQTAARRRRGNTYSQMNNDETNLDSVFTLVNANREGNLIREAVLENNNIGLFIGAIEDFDLADGRICFSSELGNPDCAPGSNSSPFNASTRYLYDSSGFPIFKSNDSITTQGSPFNGNLLAQFVEPGQERDGSTGAARPASIAYSIFRSDSILGTDEPVLSYRLLNLDGLDITQAVNSLEYILENNLLGASQPVRIRFPNSNVLGTVGSALVQNQFEQDIPTTPVPEPDTTIASLLGIGVLGAGSLLKRKVKQS
jgi:hypothetical protein